MKKINLILIIALAVCICIIALLSFLLFTNNSNNKSIAGIYQTQYFNSLNVSRTMTLKLNDDGTGKIGDNTTEFSYMESDCTWEKSNNTIIIKGTSGNPVTAEILSNGDLLLNNHQLKKLK